jgi:hypothetical protein
MDNFHFINRILEVYIRLRFNNISNFYCFIEDILQVKNTMTADTVVTAVDVYTMTSAP